MMKFYDIKAAFTSLNLAYERLINFQQFSELSLCYPPSPSENGCFGVYHIGQNRYHDST